MLGVAAGVWLMRDRLFNVSAAEHLKQDIRKKQREGATRQQDLTYTPVTSVTPHELSQSLLLRMSGSAGENLVTEEMKAALAGQIGEQIVARSQGPDAYMALVDRSSPRWISPKDEREWFLIESFEQGKVSPTPGDRSDPRAHLERIARHIFDRSTLQGWCADKEGSAFVFYRAGSVDQMLVEGHKQLPQDLIDTAYIGSGHNAIRARWPAITGEELLRRDRSVLCAESLMVVQATDGTTYGWNTRWVWDPKTSTWNCDRMARNGGSQHTMFF